jgi:hypothetical protein
VAKQCTATTLDGRPCTANALDNSDPPLCVFHHPDAEAVRQAGRSRGGKVRSRSLAVSPVPDVRLNSVSAVVEFLDRTANDVRSGRLDCKIGNALTLLCSTLLKGLQETSIEARIVALEQAAKAEREDAWE